MRKINSLPYLLLLLGLVSCGGGGGGGTPTQSTATPTQSTTTPQQEFRKLGAADAGIIPQWKTLTQSHSQEQSLTLLTQWLATQDGVARVEIVENKAIRLTDKNGHELLHVFEWDEDRGGSGPLSRAAQHDLAAEAAAAASVGKSAIVLAPMLQDDPTSFDAAYQPGIVSRLRAAGFTLSANAVVTDHLSLSMLDSLKNYDFIHIQTHGAYFRWNTGEADKVGIATGIRQSELTKAELDMTWADRTLKWTGPGYKPPFDDPILIVNEDYIRNHFSAGDFTDAWVSIDACHSSETSGLADAFFSKGAKVFVGWKGEAYSGWFSSVWSSLLPQLLANESAQAAWEQARSGFNPVHWTDNCSALLWFQWCTQHDTYFELQQSSDQAAYLLPIPSACTAHNGVSALFEESGTGQITASSSGPTVEFHSDAIFRPLAVCANGSSCSDPNPICYSCPDGQTGCGTFSQCTCGLCATGDEVCSPNGQCTDVCGPNGVGGFTYCYTGLCGQCPDGKPACCPSGTSCIQCPDGHDVCAAAS